MRLAGWLTRVDSSARIALRSAGARAGLEPARRVVDNVLEDLGSDVAIRAWRVGDVLPPRFACCCRFRRS